MAAAVLMTPAVVIVARPSSFSGQPPFSPGSSVEPSLGMNGTGSGEASEGKTEVESCRLTRSLTTAIVRGKRTDNGTHDGRIGGTETACTFHLPLMMAVCQMYKGTREGFHMEGIQLANSRRVVGRGAAQRSFWLERTLFALAARPVARASGSWPLEHS